MMSIRKGIRGILAAGLLGGLGLLSGPGADRARLRHKRCFHFRRGDVCGDVACAVAGRPAGALAECDAC